MKLRAGFVSNSSSSSFILVTKEPITEAFLRKEYAAMGPWAEPFIDFLSREGEEALKDPCEYDYPGSFGFRDESTPLENWKKRHGVEPDAYVVEYVIENQGLVSEDVRRSLYYNGTSHLETPNIRVFPGTWYC